MKRKRPHKLILFSLAFAVVAIAAGGFYIYEETIQSPPMPAVEEQPRGVVEKEPEVTLVAVGDIMLSRSVGAAIRNSTVYYPFANISEYLNNADITFGNLETPIIEGPPVLPGEFKFHADPGVELGLKHAGFDVLSLANNHVPNYDQVGVINTWNLLQKENLGPVGAGKDINQASAPVYITKNGITFAFLAFNDRDVIPRDYCATATIAGTNCFDYPLLKKSVTEAKAKADIVIVSMHAGKEYSEVNESQTKFAHAAIDAGAELVIGHHPHIIQKSEIYKGKHIYYSLGNFVFDQNFSEETRKGLSFKATFNKQGLVNVEEHKIQISKVFQPELSSN